MNKKRRASAAVIAGNGIFGFSFLFSKLAMGVTLPSVLIAVRFSVAFLLLNIIVLLGRIPGKDGKPRIRFSLKGKPKKNILLLALFQPILYFAAENYGILYTSSAFAGIIIALIPLAGIVFDILILRSRASRRQILCALFSVVGVVLTAVGSEGMRASGKGIILLLIAVAAGALFYVFSQKAGTDYSALERTYVMFGCGSAVYLVIALLQSGLQDWEPMVQAVESPIFWAAIAYLAAASSVGAFLLLNYGSTFISVSEATLYANVTTVISILAGVIILNEKIMLPQIIGAGIIIISVTFAQLKPPEKQACGNQNNEI